LNRLGISETALFLPGGVNLRACLCGVPMYASAQSLDFLASKKNCSFPNLKLLLDAAQDLLFTAP